MLDTGASNSLWLYRSTLPDFNIPSGVNKSFLGSGLSGDVYGYLSRFDMISIDRFELEDVLVSIPDSTSIEYAIGSDKRNGSLGAEVLRRFNVIIDYPNELITLSKNNKYSEPFSYNRCGIEILCPYPGINVYQVAQVYTNSPAERAGIRKHDLIISIDGIDANDLSLNEIYKLFQAKAGKKIKILIDRSGQRIKFSFELEEYIW
jgi:membrane-associated protease RseP (regulator of RpoE activity)